MKEIRDQAREKLKDFCRVCPVCNGRACAGQVPGMGGVGTGASFMNNVDALKKVKLNLRLIHDATDPDISMDFLGARLSLPVMAAPIGGISFNLGGPLSEEDYVRAVLTGCVRAGTLGMAGDGGPDYVFDAARTVISELKGAGIPILKPWGDDELFRKLALAREAGAAMAGMDIDAAGLITLRLMGREVGPKTRDKLADIIAKSGLKMIIKGIMTPQDAKAALRAGAAAIVVSNHGGRVLDHTPGTAEVLPAIAQEVGGKLIILADGGVRTGSDVVKMLALGADGVLIGRPFAWAAVGGGVDGVVKYVEQLKNEMLSTMIVTGCHDVSEINHRVIQTPQSL